MNLYSGEKVSGAVGVYGSYMVYEECRHSLVGIPVSSQKIVAEFQAKLLFNGC